MAAMDRCASATRPSKQNQHDAYGSIILAATPMFFDRRLPRPGDATFSARIEPLGEKAAKLALKPDAGIWEYRGRTRVHTHSAAMCWAGCQRLKQSRSISDSPTAPAYWGGIAEGIGEEVLERAGIPSARRLRRHLAATISTPACCCLPNLALDRADDPRFVSTVKAIERELQARSSRYAVVAVLTISACPKRLF